MKMALSLGWFHVDAMLDTAPAGQLAEWFEYYKIQPWGDDWERTSLATSRLHNALVAMMSALAGKKTSKDDLLNDEAFVPYREAQSRRQEWSAEKLKMVMRAQIGV